MISPLEALPVDDLMKNKKRTKGGRGLKNMS